MDYIAIEGETQRPVDDLRLLLPTASFPEEEIISVTGLEDFIALAGYEVCTITNLEADITPEWNQFVQLGVAARVNGALQASWSAVNMDADIAAATLSAAKDDGRASVDQSTVDVQTAAVTFSSGTDIADPEVSLSPDAETMSNLSQLLLVAQNANTGATIKDVNGNNVTLTLPQLKELTAAVVEYNADIVADRVTANAAINSATTPTQITTAVDTFVTKYS